MEKLNERIRNYYLVRFRFILIFFLSGLILTTCKKVPDKPYIQSVVGVHDLDSSQVWLSHEHILVDFIGADSIDQNKWNQDSVIKTMLPYLNQLKDYKVKYFVDATPAYLGRDPVLLKKIAERTGLIIITNTGFYGAYQNKYVPSFAKVLSAEKLADIWIGEFEHGIDKTSVKPGFIKISVDVADPLDSIHQKIVKAAALTHLKTGLTIASHTGLADGLWPQLQILKENGVSPKAFIWVHANKEENNENYLKAAQMGCWISFDGVAWEGEVEKTLEKLIFAKKNHILNKILISHDAGWYDPQKQVQTVMPYTNIFTKLLPALKAQGFTDNEIKTLVSVNLARAFSIGIKKVKSD